MSDATPMPLGAEDMQARIVDPKGLPADYPTHTMPAEFWEALGRTIATFGFLEEVLGKAIFAMTGTRELPDDDPAAVQTAVEKWMRTLERALTDQLRNLIDAFGKAVRENGQATIANPDVLLDELRKAAVIRNALCHGSWRSPDAQGRSVPFFVNRQLEVFQDPVDVAYLDQVRAAVVEMTCGVINTVTHMGYQFPGSSGPGKSVWPAR